MFIANNDMYINLTHFWGKYYFRGFCGWDGLWWMNAVLQMVQGLGAPVGPPCRKGLEQSGDTEILSIWAATIQTGLHRGPGRSIAVYGRCELPSPPQPTCYTPRAPNYLELHTQLLPATLNWPQLLGYFLILHLGEHYFGTASKHQALQISAPFALNPPTQLPAL